MKDMHTKNTLESIQSTNLLSSRTPRKVGTAEFGSRSRRQINFGSNENHFNFIFVLIHQFSKEGLPARSKHKSTITYN